MTENRFAKSLEALKEIPSLTAAEAPAAPKPLLSTLFPPSAPKQRGVSATFYLSKDVTQAVEREAKRRGINKSKLVNVVMKRVLLES